jgi:hypothetical protein
MNPRTRHNASVKTADWLARLQALSQSSWNRNVRFRSSRPYKPPVTTHATAAATARGQSRPSSSVLPPTASQRAVLAVSSAFGPIHGAAGYRPSPLGGALYHRRHGPDGPG